jgi:hypothetical protein
MLAHFRKKGVRLWSENGHLHYRAPKGALTQEEVGRLRTHRDQIVALLARATSVDLVEPRIEARPQHDSAPLTFSQLGYWNTQRLVEQRTIRGVASATRLRGRLNLDALRKSITETVRRHDALRTRIVIREGVPVQEIDEPDEYNLKVHDLARVPEGTRESEVKRLIDQHVDQLINVGTDSLFAASLLELGADEHVLIVAMEHIISDGASRNILLRDIFTIYVQVLQGCAVSLPEIAIQFADFATWQMNARRAWLEKHGAYWHQHLAGCQHLEFPADRGRVSSTAAGFGVVPLSIGLDLKEELREWCRVKHTTLPMCVFTAYIAFVLRWCNVADTVILYQTDGRSSPKIQNTIGYFAFRLFLRIKLLEEDDFLDLMRRVTEEYCNAYEHADSGYMEAQLPKPGFTQNTNFNWVNQGPSTDQFEVDGPEGPITGSLIPFNRRVVEPFVMDNEPTVGLRETADGIFGLVMFPLNRFSFATMEVFADGFLMFVKELLRRPQGRVRDLSIGHLGRAEEARSGPPQHWMNA